MSEQFDFDTGEDILPQKHNVLWSGREIRVLLNCIEQGKSRQEIAVILGRKKHAVDMKIYQMRRQLRMADIKTKSANSQAAAQTVQAKKKAAVKQPARRGWWSRLFG